MTGEFFLGLSEPAYNDIDAARRSDLSLLCDKPPSHLIERRRSRYSDDTDSKVFGVGYHLAVLEPERLERVCVEMLEAPVSDKGKRGWFKDADKERRDAWLDEQAKLGKLVLPRESNGTRPFDVLRRMRDKLWAHPTASQMLGGQGKNEVSLVWDDPIGIRCKARLDRIASFEGRGCLLDIKTSSTGVGPEEFEKTYSNFNYHRQAFFYLRAAEHVFGYSDRAFYFVVQETTAPYEVAVYEASPSSIDAGMAEMEKAMRLYKHCQETGEWPGYPSGVQVVGLPQWRLNRDARIPGEELL